MAAAALLLRVACWAQARQHRMSISAAIASARVSALALRRRICQHANKQLGKTVALAAYQTCQLAGRGET